jgi:excisionase family DNA binding protein
MRDNMDIVTELESLDATIEQTLKVGVDTPTYLKKLLDSVSREAGLVLIAAKKSGALTWDWIPTNGELATESPEDVFKKILIEGLGEDYTKLFSVSYSGGKWSCLKTAPTLVKGKRRALRVALSSNAALDRLKGLAIEYRTVFAFLLSIVQPKPIDRSKYHPQPMTLGEIADKLNISDDTAGKYIRSGDVRAIPVGNRWRVHKEDI